MKFIKYLFLLVVCTGCTAHFGRMGSSVVLTKNNFKIIGNVTGESKTQYFLGIGGFDPDNLILAAKIDMQNKYKLKQGQAYVNMTVNNKITYWILGYTHRYIVNADVVQFLEKEYNTIDTSKTVIAGGMPDNGLSSDTLSKRYDLRDGFYLNEKVKITGGETEYEARIKELFVNGATVIKITDNTEVYQPFRNIKKIVK